MRHLVVVVLAIVALSGCGGLEKGRVEQERAFFNETKTLLPLVDKSDLTDLEKQSWHNFFDGHDARIRQEEEAVK